MAQNVLKNKPARTPLDLNTPESCTWCPGCGDFAIWAALKQAAIRFGWDNTNTALVAGIGCHGHLVNFLALTSFEGLHGRAIPVASGLKMANHDLNVFVITGDGDCLAEGGNHFVQASRRNQNITVILYDNAIYALTTGQTSPRSPRGFKSKSTPFGNIEEPVHPLRLALASGATFLARAYAGDIPHLIQMIKEANAHQGFAVLQVLQPCVTFNHVYTHQFYQENTYKLGPEYDPTDQSAAWKKTLEWGLKQIPVGVLYQVHQPTYEAQVPQIQTETLVKQGVQKRDIRATLKKFQ